ncbi:MAG: pyruvate formate lyase family protein, partial [Eisenbergiella massiliensis]
HYIQVAEVNEALLNHPPRTLREACQFTAHFQCIDRMYYAGGALGQIDELFRPFYEKDKEIGGLTDEEAVWYFASLFFNDTHYSQIGGLTPSGDADMVSRVSFLVLDAVHYLKIPSNVAIRVHDSMNETLLRRSLEYNMEDGTGVCYSCNVGCEEGFAKNGYPMELARMRIKSGCNWTAIPGVEYPLQDVTRLSMPMAFHWAMEDMRPLENKGTKVLWELFVRHLTVMVNCIKDGYDWHYEHISEDTPEIILNLFMHGPVERGLNCAQGGVDIMDLNIDGIGLATVADSFAAIEQRIEKEQALTFEELYQALDADYEGYENIRLMLKNIDRLGAPHSPAMKWAERTRDLFVALCMNEPTPKHRLKVIAGMFSHGDIVRYGETLPATPNGRKYGEPISHSNEPDPGFASGLHTFSPSLKANTVAKLQPGYGNSSPLHLDVDNSMITKEGGVDALETLIHTHNHMGGTLINLNCLTRERLLKAHADPDSDPDLVVRVTGYSAFFSSLSPKYRQQIVDRFLN